MINIDRLTESPTSLESPEIQQFINDIQAHLNDSENFPKPKVPGTYRTSDLLDAFDQCFHSKCYLTEQWFPNAWCMDVEHFVSQDEDPSKRYEWSNLFPAEHRANKMKPRQTPDGGYLNPCNPEDDVEYEIQYSLSALGQEPNFTARNPENIKAVNTSNLLNRIHNGHNNDTKLATASLRYEIQKKYDHILHLMIQWLASPDGSNIKHQYEMELRFHLSRRSSFTMLLRNMVTVLNHIPDHFLD